MNDLGGISYAVDLVSLENFNPEIILASERFEENLQKIETEIERISKTCKTQELAGDLLLFEIETKYHLISRFTRLISAANPSKVAMVVDEAKGSVYVRRGELDLDLSQLISWGKEKGLSTGGKKEVLGVQCRPEQIQQLKEDLTEKIGGLTR